MEIADSPREKEEETASTGAQQREVVHEVARRSRARAASG